MDCTINEVKFDFDKEGRIKNTIGRVAGSDTTKLYVLATYVKNQDFLRYVSDNINESDIIKGSNINLNNISSEDLLYIKQNKLYSLLKDYYLANHTDVNNSKTNKSFGRLFGFSSSVAKKIAKDYVADSIIRKYSNELGLPKEQRRKDSNKIILKEVVQDIEKTFFDRAVSYANVVINDDNYDKEAKDYAQKLIDTITKGELLAKDINELSLWLNSMNKDILSYKNRKLTKEEKEELDNKISDYNKYKKEYTDKIEAIGQIKTDRYVIAQNLINNYPSKDNEQKIRDINFANLVNQVKTNSDEFFFEVFTSKRMNSIVKDFNKIGNISEFIEEQDENNDNIDIQYNAQNIDETSKTWEDNLYKSFNQTIGTRMKILLSNIPNLTQPYNETENALQDIDTNNELGVPTYMDAQFLTVQIYSFGDFTTVDSMINSLDAKAKSIRKLYGLGGFINRLKTDRELANYVYVQFAKPIVHKVMCTINDINSEDGISFDYSNNNAFNETKVAFEMMNKLRATYNSSYDGNDINILRESINKFKSDKTKEKAIDELYKVLINYFPNIEKNTFDAIFTNTDNPQNTFINIESYLESIIDEIGKLKTKINKQIEANNKKYKEDKINYARQLALSVVEGTPTPPMPERVQLDLSIYKFSSTINRNIIKLSKVINKYNTSSARLNTANADGNTSSDVMKNSYITRFFEQIMAESETDANAGLNALKDYLMQGNTETQDNQYANNPIFFGLKDLNGNVVVHGMFTRTGSTATINDNAKDILKYALFDGTKNNSKGIGMVYEQMPKIDFFLTQYIAFSHSVPEITDNGTITKIGDVDSAVYPMRIGSDAPKIFMIRAPRYNNSQLRLSFYNHLLDEFNMFVNAINNVFKEESQGIFKTTTSIDNLFGRAYFDEKAAAKIRQKRNKDFTAAIVKDGKLVGNMFKFKRLFKLDNYDAEAEINQLLSLYGEDNRSLFIPDKDGRLRINMSRITDTSFIKLVNGKFVLSLQNSHKEQLMRIVDKWMNAYQENSKTILSDYIEALNEQNISYTEDSINNFLLNSANMNMNYDDMFEGDFKYYNNARDFLKRTKETQAGGDAYAGSDVTSFHTSLVNRKVNNEPEYITVKQLVNNQKSQYTCPVFDNGSINVNGKMIARNGWRAVTIFNTVSASDFAEDLKQTLKRQFIKEGMSEEDSETRANKIAGGYFSKTKINDAQSYITLEEFIRRKYADGTLIEYQDILAQLLDPNVKVEDIDLDEINARIQIQKNFYYDKQYDANTNDFYPRQIKNAEFVIIPKLLPEDSDLIKVYNWMKANDIGQLNTAETDKAAKKNIFSIWDEQTGNLIEDFDKNFNENYVQNYYYQYLYKQQDVPQHMVNEENKLGAQISKKIIDNVSTASKEVQNWANEYQDAVTQNMIDDFETFLDRMGWEVDKTTGKIINSEYAITDANGNPLTEEEIESNKITINFNNFFTRAREEASRLGMDSNFMEYLIPDEFGKTRMPLDMNTVLFKLESVAQSLYNRTITRQVLPGWHAAQITGVGYSKKLKFDAETGIMEVRLPRWSNIIPKGKNKEENDRILKQIQEEGLDIHLGYRIPTEGKQSIAILKVVGFVDDCLGSTIVVPDEWVTQTGSDFDVDSVYGICWEMYKTTDKKGNIVLKKIPFEEDTTDNESLYISYVNRRIDEKVKRDDLGNEIKSNIKDLKDRLYAEKLDENNKKNVEFNLEQEHRNKLYPQLPNDVQWIIREENSKAKRKAKKDGNTVVDLRDVYSRINKRLNDYIENNPDNKNIDIIKEYIDSQNILIDIMNVQEGIFSFDKDKYYDEKAEVIKSTIEKAKQDYLNKIETIAKDAGLMSYNEFVNQLFVNRLSRQARNNFIFDRMLKIMKDSSSREEQYGRSQFEAITNGDGTGANNVVNKLYGITNASVSPYNPLDQLNYFDDAMSGARLKARSVNWDTLTSKCNRMQVELSDEDAIDFELVLDEPSAPESQITYNETFIRNSYKDNITYDKDKNKIVYNARKLGWSNNNKNIVNEFVTTYTSQTTAHHLDAVKEGSIPNVNEYTFDVYKFITCIGLDHEVSVGFMRQPIINRLVSNYNLSNSIFFGSSSNAINMTISDIANDLKLNIQTKYGSLEITKNTNVGQILAAFKNNSEFVEAFNNQFNIDLSKMSTQDIYNLKVPISKYNIFNRIKLAAENKSNKANDYNTAAFDLGMILTFNHIRNTTQKLNTIIQLANTDKNGAYSSIREARRIIEGVAEYRNDMTLQKDGISFIDLIYPLDEKGDINVSNSKYKPIAAAYSYSTKRSVETNSKLFITENDDYVYAEHELERYIKHKLNDAEYKEYKRYVLSFLYNKISKLLTPVSVDNRGRIIPFIEDKRISENKLKSANYNWNAERSRIVGYGITDEGNFSVKDINKPTKDEIEEYIKLTPAQKINFLQKNFNDNQGIFNVIKITLINNTDAYKRGGLSRQFLNYDDQVENIEDIYEMFNYSFNNHNPLIKLAAIDLVKYAFIAEGFNFKAGYISKIIPNNVLYADESIGGFDIIDNSKGIRTLLNELAQELSKREFIELFVRSHSEYAPIYQLPKIKTWKTDPDTGLSYPVGNNITIEFIRSIRPDYMVFIDGTSVNQPTRDLINRLRLKQSAGGYIKIDRPVTSKTNATTLYNVVAGNPIYKKDKAGNVITDSLGEPIVEEYGDYYLIPMNLLEKYESYDISYNSNYNKFNTIDYYLDKAEEIERVTSSIRRSNKVNDIVQRTNTKVKSNIIPIGKFTANNNQTINIDEYLLMKLANNPDEYIKGGAIKFLESINKQLINQYKKGLGDGITYIVNQNPYISNIFAINNKYKQEVSDEQGNVYEINIVRLNNDSKLTFTLSKLKEGGYNDIHLEYAKEDIKRYELNPKNVIIYKASIAPKTDKEILDDIKLADTDTIIDTENIISSSNLARRGRLVDQVSASIIKQITYEARKNDSSIAEQFVRNMDRLHISRNFRDSLIENRENIYKAAARYYRSAANKLINTLNSYEIDGVIYKMSDEAMYEALAKNDEQFGEVAKIILDSVTFGNRISDIMNIDIAAEDKETADAIQSIRDSINLIKTNTIAKQAMANIMNIYFKKYSTNPMIAEGLMKIRDQFGDIDTAVALISDPAEINNTEVQVILKHIYSMFSKAELFDAKRNVEEWKSELSKVNSMEGTININNIIDSDKGILRQDYNEKFLEDKQKVIDDFNTARENRMNSIDAYGEYLRKQLARDKFMYEHTEQPIISEYYEEDIKNRETAILKGGRIFFEYRMLSEQLYDISNNIEATNEETQNLKNSIIIRMNYLKSVTEENGEEKIPSVKQAAEAINEYISKRKELNEKYFDTQEYEGFRDDYNRYNNYIKSFDAAKPHWTIEEKLMDSAYKEAYEWIKNNGRIAYTQEANDKINAAFKKLTGKVGDINTTILAAIRKIPGVIDEAGIIDGTKLTDEQITIIKKEQESELSTKYTAGDGEIILIKDVSPEKELRIPLNTAVVYKEDPEKFKTIGRINEIIGKAVNKDTGELDITAIFNNDIISENERKELIDLYNYLYEMGADDLFVPKDPEQPRVEWQYEWNRYNNALSYYETNLKNTRQGVEFLKLFTHIDNAGNIQPNVFIYGKKKYPDELIDKERTEAYKLIQDNIEFVKTPYYYKAMNEATEKGVYNEWFKNNHVYNPFSHKYEPLKIWTTREAKPNSELSKSTEYVPSFNNMEKTVKKEYVNGNYKRFGNNYKKGDIKYDNNIKLNAKEEALKKLIQQTLNKYASTYQGKRFVGQGYLPRERATEVTTKWVIGQFASLFGWSFSSGHDSDSFRDIVDYSHDKEADMRMLQLLKGKGTKKYLPLPNRADFKTEEEYKKELERIKEENKKIAIENLKIDNASLSKDWLKVMEDFVYNATIFNSRQEAKPYLYLLLEDLSINNAYMIKGLWNKSLVKNTDTSTKDDTQYRMEQQTKTKSIVHNLARRLLYDQYHEGGALRNVSNLLQNLSSAKFMVFNAYGGVANVATGSVNINMEVAANEYFGINEMKQAEAQYLRNSLNFIATEFSEHSPNLTVALCKQFHIVDFDQILQNGATEKDVSQQIRKVRNYLYSFQSVGEHFMQNSVLLAMLKSNRLYTDSKGIMRIGDFKDYTIDLEIKAMRSVLASYPDLLINYELYLKSIRIYDVETRMQLSMGRKDINRNFLYGLRDNVNEELKGLYKTIANKYNKERNDIIDKEKTVFNSCPTVESLYILKNGEAVINPTIYAKFENNKNIIGDIEHLIGGFREKVKAVNKKIHGVYDKDGAAQIEAKWWGSILMQYHKHLPTGIWKRFRRKGYYNEFRGSIERGTYQTLIDFLGTEFVNFKDRTDNRSKNGTNVALASLQTTIESIINTITNIQFNWNNLSRWEKANIRRNLAELGGILSACLIVVSLYSFGGGDDEINDSLFKSSCLYLADRLYAETTMYSPWGMIAEAKTLWSNPIAGSSIPVDLLKGAQLITTALFDPDYNPNYTTGRYAGENKLEILIRRNIPGIRPYDRIMNITKNNTYYKVGQSRILLNIAKNFGDMLREE